MVLILRYVFADPLPPPPPPPPPGAGAGLAEIEKFSLSCTSTIFYFKCFKSIGYCTSICKKLFTAKLKRFFLRIEQCTCHDICVGSIAIVITICS